MGIANMKIYKKSVFWNILLSRRYWQKCDFFLSKKKTTSGPRQLGPVCSDLLHKNKFGSFSFFWLTKHFLLKRPSDFQPFCLRKPVTLLSRGLRVRSDGLFFLLFPRKQSAFLKNGINIFWGQYRQEKKLLVTF